MNLFQENSVFKDSPFGEHWDKPIDQWAIPEFGYAKILNKRNLIIADKSDKIPHGQADGYSAVINNDGPKYTFKVYSHPDGEKVLQMYNEFKINEKQPYEVTVFIETNDGKFDFGKIVRVKFGPAVIEDLKYKYLSELPWKDNDPEDIAEKFIKAAWVNSVSQQTKDKVDNERKGADFEDLLVKAIQYEYDNKKFDDFSWFILMIKGTEYVGFKLSDWCFSSAKWLRERKYLEDKYWNGDLPEKEFTPAFLPDSIFYENNEDREKALKEYFREPFIKLRRYVGEKIDGDGSFEKKLALELYSKINDLQEVSDVLVENFLSEIAIPDDFYIESYIKHVHAFEVGLYNGIVEFVAGICDLTAIVVLVCRQELGFRMTDALTEKFENFVNDLYYKTIETLKKIWQAIINLFKDFEKWYEQFSEYDGKSYKILKELGELIPDILTFVIPVLKGSKAAKIAKAGEEVAEITEKTVVKEAVEEISENEAKKIAKTAKEALGNDELSKGIDEIVAKTETEINNKTQVPEQLDEVEIKKQSSKKIKQAAKMWDQFDYEDLLKIPPKKKPCFLEGTLVKTEKGLISIENISIGDKIYSYNFDTKQSDLQMVSEVYQNIAEIYLQIKTENDIIGVTGQHRFWIPVQKNWIMANGLQVGMEFLSFDNKLVTILSLEIISKTRKTFNLEVETHHNYFVGKDELLTHNATRPSKFASTEKFEFEFYDFMNVDRESLYVGQTTQGVGIRYQQHELEFKNNQTAKAWFKEVEGFFKIRINGISGPFTMTQYEAAVTEMYEINFRGGKRNGSKGLFNKLNPISRAKFDKYKKIGSFNPCKFYV